MQVALVGNYPLDPCDIKNGPQAVFTYLVDGLKQLPGLDLHVVTGKQELDHAMILEREGVHFYYLPYSRLPTELSYHIMRRRVHQILRQIEPDLVHGQSGHRYGAMCLSTNFPTVITTHNVHGHDVPFIPGKFNRLRLGLQYALSRRYFISKVRHIVSISPYIRCNFEPVVRAKFYDIDNPISDSFFNLDPEREVPYQVLFAGLIRGVKRPDLAVSALALAVKQVPQLCLKLAGASIEPALYSQLQQFVAENSLQNNVQFLGHLHEPQILEAYQNTSVFLLTSDLETSPMVVEQALAAGKPVVVTDGGGTRFLVDHGRNGFVVERGNAAAIADALVRLVCDNPLRKEFGRHARQAALSRFKSDIVAKKMYQVYQRVLRGAVM